MSSSPPALTCAVQGTTLILVWLSAALRSTGLLTWHALEKGLSRTCCLCQGLCPSWHNRPSANAQLKAQQEEQVRNQAKPRYTVDKIITSPLWTVKLLELRCLVESPLSLAGFSCAHPHIFSCFLLEVALSWYSAQKEKSMLRLISGHCFPFTWLSLNSRCFLKKINMSYTCVWPKTEYVKILLWIEQVQM